MANTYTQIHLHLVFAVKHRAAVIAPDWKYDLYGYMTGIIQNHSHKVLAINGMPDHVHILIGMRPTQSVSDLMQQLKQESSGWINDNRRTSHRFAWQEGYGAFSYSKSQLPAVIRYIDAQEEHHRTRSFIDEYSRMLDTLGIDYDERYVFKPLA
ncbi:IS200/IS605 family transposase [Spirosoma sordidisoli]|uniref:IS200/IS605 family transposase n=1 Tax=Spirosoma sordidisoli TaxID=2502893 RepID=A0A4Q2UMK7_9BACT|nr:IS200/IS605 family transposase [Spirosoma sordidisoli]RYC68800.1 IS200/IS605 family transposase [Spirosoma sordidisoli]